MADTRRRRASSTDGADDRAAQRPRTNAAGSDPERAGAVEANATGSDTESVDAVEANAARSDTESVDARATDDGPVRTTPEPRLDLLKLSSSPSRVYGRRAATGTAFAKYDVADLCKVDKSLVCIGFWETVVDVARICLPRRSGKTYNLTQLLLFFSRSSEQDQLGSIPDDILIGEEQDPQAIAEMSIVDRCREKRKLLFADSLLHSEHPEFFDRHFMKHPVLHFSLAKCVDDSYDAFVVSLCHTIAMVAERWVDEVRLSGTAISDNASRSFVDLKSTLDKYRRVCDLLPCLVAEYDELVCLLFLKLSEFVFKQFGQYILLDNNHLCKGLLLGVFEVQMTWMGSGANSIKDIPMVPVEESDIRGGISLSDERHTRNGMDALTDAFWFNATEIRQMVDVSLGQALPSTADRLAVTETIKEWYNGYYIGRFRGKYNPWSVVSYIQNLRDILSGRTSLSGAVVTDNIGAAAKIYWVTTGTTRLIDVFTENYPKEISRLTDSLIHEYQANKYRPSDSQGSADPDMPPLRVSLMSTSLDVLKPLGRQFEKAEFLSLCLYGGYLTRRTIGTICIPNQELFMVWRRLFGCTTTGSTMTTELETGPRGKLLKDLWANDTDFMCSLVKSTHGALANHNAFKEKEYADHASAAFRVAVVFGALTHPNQPTIGDINLVMSRESHVGRGRCDCLMRLYSTANRPNEFGVLVEYKLIPRSLRATVVRDLARQGIIDDEDAIEDEVARRAKAIAETGLSQIATTEYATGLAGCLERMDVCLAINNDVVYAASQLFKRSSSDARSRWKRVDNLMTNIS
ncbi:hypothetical protein IW146_001356 [Coemansia sp. RSA 922]|nr:hypothetical protein IW146_001356 [Coemansia sp. RSA 922]